MGLELFYVLLFMNIICFLWLYRLTKSVLKLNEERQELKKLLLKVLK